MSQDTTDNLTLLLRDLPRRTRSLLEAALGDRRQARRLGEKVALALREGPSSPEWELLADQFALDPAALCDLRPPIDAHCLVALNASSNPGLEHTSVPVGERTPIARDAADLVQ